MYQFSNNTIYPLTSGLASGDTTLNITITGTPSFAAVTSGNVQVATLTNATRTLFEIVNITAFTSTGGTGYSLTITRAQEGTTALTWAAGDLIFAGVTAGILETIQTALSTAGKTYLAGAGINIFGATDTPTIAAYPYTGGAGITVTEITGESTSYEIAAIPYTAGTGIDITSNVISSTGGGGGVVSGLDSTNLLNSAATGAMSYVPRELAAPTMVGDPYDSASYYTTVGNEVILRFPLIDIGLAPDWSAGDVFIGTVVKSTSNPSIQFRAVVNNTLTGAPCVTDTEPDPTLAYQFVDTSNELIWVTQDTSTDALMPLPDVPSVSSNFVPTEAGLMVITDGATIDSATISFGNDTDSNTWLVDNYTVNVDDTTNRFYFRFPITEASKVFSLYAWPTFAINTAGTVGSMAASPYIKGFFLQDDRNV
jgi:hypothetical protein